MSEQTKKKYQAPMLTVVNIKSEQGYSASNPSILQALWIGTWISDSDPSNVYGIENYNVEDLTW